MNDVLFAAVSVLGWALIIGITFYAIGRSA